MSVISTTMQNFIQNGIGVSVPCMRDFAPLGTKWLGYFLGSWERPLSGPSWITPPLLQLCVSGADVLQLVWRRVVVISSTAFNSDIRTVVGWYSGLIFLQLSVMTLWVLIHDDRLIHKVYLKHYWFHFFPDMVYTKYFCNSYLLLKCCHSSLL